MGNSAKKRKKELRQQAKNEVLELDLFQYLEFTEDSWKSLQEEILHLLRKKQNIPKECFYKKNEDGVTFIEKLLNFTSVSSEIELSHRYYFVSYYISNVLPKDAKIHDKSFSDILRDTLVDNLSVSFDKVYNSYHNNYQTNQSDKHPSYGSNSHSYISKKNTQAFYIIKEYLTGLKTTDQFHSSIRDIFKEYAQILPTQPNFSYNNTDDYSASLYFITKLLNSLETEDVKTELRKDSKYNAGNFPFVINEIKQSLVSDFFSTLPPQYYHEEYRETLINTVTALPFVNHNYYLAQENLLTSLIHFPVINQVSKDYLEYNTITNRYETLKANLPTQEEKTIRNKI